jgi:hypothetical protein
VLRPKPADWPICRDDPRLTPQRLLDVTPLRHDLALACYLEKQAANRVSTIHRSNPWTTLIAIGAWAARSPLAFLRHLPEVPTTRLRNLAPSAGAARWPPANDLPG